MPINYLILIPLETALNRYLALADNASQFLGPLAGKVIAVTIEPFGVSFYLCPTADTIQVIDTYTATPDTHLTGSLAALGLMGLSSHPMRALFSGQVQMTGDSHTGRKFQELFAKLDINLEAKLANYLGNDIAHKLSVFFRVGQNWGMQSLATLGLNTSEFLQEETRELPPQAELDIFYHQIDTIRTDFDRLHSRVERLATLLDDKHPAKGIQ